MATLEYSEVPIDAVAVYLSSAEITRRVVLNFESAGPQSVRIYLPGTDVDLSTVRATISGGTSNSTIVKLDSGVEECTFHNRLDRYPKARPLYDQFLVLTKKHQQLRGEEAALARAIANIEATLKYLSSATCPVALTDFSAQCQIMKEARTQSHPMTSRHQEVQRLLKVSMSEVRTVADKLKKALKMDFRADPNHPPVAWLRSLHGNLVQPNGIDNRLWVKLSMHAEQPGSATLTVTYLTQNATWRPSYDFRISSGQDQELELTYFAYLSQNTGEDWTDVSVSLHAGNPSTAGAPPPLNPLTVRVKEPVPKAAAPGRLMAQSRSGMLMRAPVPPMAVAAMECAADECEDGSNGAAQHGRLRLQKRKMMRAAVRGDGAEVQAAFDLPKRWDIESSSNDYRFVITQASLACNILNFCSPEASAVVYRAARVMNTTGCIMMEAPAAIYWDGALIANTDLRTVAPGDYFEAFFGEDERVRVEVRPQQITNKTRGVLTSAQVRDVVSDLTLRNQREEAVRVMFVYRLPVSTSGDIKVVPELPTTMKKWAGESDLEAVEQIVAASRIAWVHNSLTDHCIGILKAAGKSSTTVTFKYYVESTSKAPIVIAS